MSLNVLFVCTGNICRSPMAERLFLARSALHAGSVARSCGVNAVVGAPMERSSARALTELGGDPSGHVAQSLSESLIAEADLILGAEAEHRDIVLRLAPATMRRTFVLREFVRLGASVPAAVGIDQATAVIAAVASRRGLADTVRAGFDDIADPYRRPMHEVRECSRQVLHAVGSTLRLLGAGQTSASPRSS